MNAFGKGHVEEAKKNNQRKIMVRGFRAFDGVPR